jgi:hypothetical protein
MKLGHSRHIFEKSSNIKFNENPSGGSGIVLCGRTDGQTDRRTERHDEAKVAIRNFANAPKNGFPTMKTLSTANTIRENGLFYTQPHRKNLTDLGFIGLLLILSTD